MHLLAFLPGWFWHPLGTQACHAAYHSAAQVRDCLSYNFYSGSLSDIAEITLVGGIVTLVLGFWHKHNCHVHRCWRLSWHVDPAHGHPVCKKHHPDHPKGGEGGGLRALGHNI